FAAQGKEETGREHQSALGDNDRVAGVEKPAQNPGEEKKRNGCCRHRQHGDLIAVIAEGAEEKHHSSADEAKVDDSLELRFQFPVPFSKCRSGGASVGDCRTSLPGSTDRQKFHLSSPLRTLPIFLYPSFLP